MNLNQDQINDMLVEIRNISHGGLSGPLGLEAVAMALAGEGNPGEYSVSRGLSDVAAAIGRLAEAVETATQDKHQQ